MFHSRRGFMAATAAAAVAALPLELRAAVPEEKNAITPETILSVFKGLPGDLAVKIHAPAANGKPEFLVESNASKVMFVGSAVQEKLSA
jgi:beta-lactamase class A